MSNPPDLHRAGAALGWPSQLHLDRRRLCAAAVASLIVPGAVHPSRPDAAPRVVIRDGWILLETDLK